LDIDAGNLDAVANNYGLGQIDITPAGYLRWVGSGSPTFEWSMLIGSTSLSNSNTASLAGTASTSQDATSGIGEVLRITFVMAGRSVTTPSSGDSVVFAVRGAATLSGVVHTAKVEITLNFL
jgi:hypothetical protein